MFIMYSRVRKPGISMVNQAIRPGILKTLSTDVLPMPYHGNRYWIRQFCTVHQPWPVNETGGNFGRAYHWKESPDEQQEVVILLGRRIPVLDERHGREMLEIRSGQSLPEVGFLHGRGQGDDLKTIWQCIVLCNPIP